MIIGIKVLKDNTCNIQSLTDKVYLICKIFMGAHVIWETLLVCKTDSRCIKVGHKYCKLVPPTDEAFYRRAP